MTTTMKPAGVSILKLPRDGADEACDTCGSDLFWTVEIEASIYVEENELPADASGPAIIAHLQSQEGLPDWLLRADPGDATKEPGHIIVIDGPPACRHAQTIQADTTIRGYGRTVQIDGVALSPRRSQAILNHSPDGFNWGYGGSGPAQLSLALLLEAGASDEEATRHHQEFKWQMIATLEGGRPFEMAGSAATEWLAAKRREQ